MMRRLADHKELIVLGATYSFSNVAARLMRPALAGVLTLLLAACQNAAAPAPIEQPPAPTPVAFIPIDDLLKASVATQSEVTTAGYLVVDRMGAMLVDSLSFTADGTPRMIEGDASQIWLGAGTGVTLRDQLRAVGDLQFATVQARGRLEGPGGYGPSNRYRYQMIDPSIELIAARETTIGELLDHPADNEGRLVRLAGGLIARDSSALLVEQLGAGGLPQPKARQIKLRAPLRDRELLRQLKGVSGGAVRFGQVQVEGFWRGGMLIPLSIVLVT
jgi:hypothetical protein